MKPFAKNVLRFTFYVLFILLVASQTRAAYAQQPTPSDNEVNAIARQLYCPVCENTPLDVCPTQACAQWRDLIHQMLAEGKSSNEIKQYFVENYGARVLSEPPRTGLNWLAYLVPPVAFLAGVCILFRAFRSWRALAKEPVTGTGAASTPAADDEYVARLEEELRKRG
jgi:cytochrome c-type biogenesis protein CcmH